MGIRNSSSRWFDPEQDGYVAPSGRVQHVVHGHTTAEETERRAMLRQAGVVDRGQSLPDARNLARRVAAGADSPPLNRSLGGGVLTRSMAQMGAAADNPEGLPAPARTSFFSGAVGERNPETERKANAAISRSPISFDINRPGYTGPGVVKPSAPTGGSRVADSTGAAWFGPVAGANGYGSGSVRYAGAGEALPPATVTEAGVTRQAPADLATMRAATLKQFPAVGVAGSPENAAFVAHSNRFGEAAAHQNAGPLLATLQPATGAPTAATAKNDISGAPTTEQIAQLDSAVAAGQAPGAVRAGRAVADTAEKVGGTIAAAKALPGRILDAGDRAAQSFVKGLTGVDAPIKPVSNFAHQAADWFSGADKRVSDATGVNPDGTPSRPQGWFGPKPNPVAMDDEEKRRQAQAF